MAGSGLVMPGNHIKQGCFTGAVGSDQTGDPAPGDFQADAVDSPDTAEVHVETIGTNHGRRIVSGTERF